MIRVGHNAGFFSCCSVRLEEIVKFTNKYRKLPTIVDSSRQFVWYKAYNKDVTFDYFEHYDNINDVSGQLPIDYDNDKQFSNYSELDYERITPLVKKYFSPSDEVNTRVDYLEKKYSIDYDNTVAVYYRGSDKCRETKIPSFHEFYLQILEIVKRNKDIKVILQTDSYEFIEYMQKMKLENIVIIIENLYSLRGKGVHNEHSPTINYKHMFDFLPTLIILSKCKYIVCNSGNCSIWTMFYRGDGKNTIQYLNGVWYNSAF